MTKASSNGVRFLMTRVAVGSLAVVTLLTAWGGIAISAAKDTGGDYEDTESVPAETLALAVSPPVEAAAAVAPAPASPPDPGVIVVERQPIIYVTEYVTLPAATGDSAAPSTAVQPAPSSAPAGTSGNSVPSAALPAPTPVVVTQTDPPPPLPVIPAQPAAPVAPPPTQAPAPTVAPAPPAPPPKPAATSKKSKGS